MGSGGVLGVPNSLERGGSSAVSHWWGNWLRKFCHPGGPQLFGGGREITNAHWWAE